MKGIICFAALIALAATAGAQTTTPISYSFSGTCTGSLSNFTCTSATGTISPSSLFGTSSSKITVTGGSASGTTTNFTVTFSDGDTLTASTSSDTTTPVSSTSEIISGNATITGGTGAFAGASGSYSFSNAITATTTTSGTFVVIGSGSITTKASSTGGTTSSTAPSIGKNAILNVASYAYVGLPNSSIAQGSLFTIFGTNLGPSSSPALGFPLQTTLGGVTIAVTSGSTTVNAIPMYVSATQISAVLPDNTPTGSATLTVSYNGQTSAAAPFQVVASSFGIFAANQAGSGPGIITNAGYQVLTLTSALHPNDVGIIWGTGLGASPGDTGSAPPPQTNLSGLNLSVYVGTTQATVLYQGRSFFTGEDQINFQIPSGVLGCHVPIAVLIGNVVSNFVTMPIAPAGTNTCSDPTGPTTTQLTGIASSGTVSTGGVGLTRTTSTVNLGSLGGTQTSISDGGSAAFDKYTYQQVLSANPFQTFTLGACTVYTFTGSSAGNVTTGGVTPTYLDAGSQITVTGPNGVKQLPKTTTTVNGQTTISYYASLGGNASGQSLYLSPGSYMVSGPGGADVGAFSQTVNIATPLTWTNSSITTVNRSAGQVITWTGGDPSSEVVIDGFSLVLGTNPDGSDSVGGFFYCVAPQSAGQFTVPAVVLLSLPASVANALIPIPLGSLVVSNQIEVPMTIPNISLAYFSFAAETSQSVTFQ